MDKILEQISPEQLLEESQDLIDALKTALGFQDAHFQSLCVPMLKAFALHVQGVPLSKAHYNESKGAWHFGLYASMVATQVATTNIFYPDMGSEERRRIEPQCRYAAFAAMLATAVSIACHSGQITANAKDEQTEYHPLVSSVSLHSWLTKYPSSHFKWRVNTQPYSQAEHAAIAASFLPKSLLARFDMRVVLMIFNAIAPPQTISGVEPTLTRVVRLSMTKVLEKYTKDASSRYSYAVNDVVPTLPDFSSAPAVVFNPMSQPDTGADGKDSEQISSPAMDEISRKTFLDQSSKVLISWFEVLKGHKHYPDLRQKIKLTSAGLEVPIPMLGLFGATAPMIKKLMEDAGMIISRTEDQNGIILHRSLAPLMIFDEEEPA